MGESSRLERPQRVPRHVVLIPDGNARWASARGLPVYEGHRRGAKAVEAFLQVCLDWEVHYVTVWAFSTENWERSWLEVSSIMRLIETYLRRNRGRFERDGIRFRHIGRRDRLRLKFSGLMALLEEIERETSGYGPFTLNLALDYGGRDEVVRAVRRLLAEGVDPGTVSWELLESYLDTAGQPEPDLIIRTSGEQRLSGILPLQAAYAELVFVSELLPDMDEEAFQRAILEFAGRERRFGGRPGVKGSR